MYKLACAARYFWSVGLRRAENRPLEVRNKDVCGRAPGFVPWPIMSILILDKPLHATRPVRTKIYPAWVGENDSDYFLNCFLFKNVLK
jgi:hypothetical protein